MKVAQKILVAVAVLFGLLTVVAGAGVLLGVNPGYIVFLPLVIYNAAMGSVYIVAGIIAWRNLKQGMFVAAAIFLLNFSALTVIFFMSTENNSIAVDSLRAMSLRTVVWFALFSGFWWIYRTNNNRETYPPL